jgi:hypothetical protein
MKGNIVMEQMHGMQQNGETRIGYGEGLDEQLAEWSAELFRDPQYRNTWADAEHTWRLESAARTRLIIKKQLREEIEQEMAKELGLPANWRGGNQPKRLAEWHEKMACLAKADAAPRCEHVFQDGTRCGSPRMKTGEFCYAHERMARVRPKKLNLLAMEDANAIMLNIMEINRALVDEEITEKRAGMLLYSQQLGLQALGKLTFQKTRPEELVRLEEIAADQRRKAQIRGEEFSRESTASRDRRTRMDTNEEELTAEDAEEEVSEAGEGGRDELSPVDSGMEKTGEGHRQEEFTAKDAKIAKEEEQARTAEVAENAEEEGVAADERREAQIGNKSLGGGALPRCSSHDLKELASEIPEARRAQQSEQVWTRPA